MDNAMLINADCISALKELKDNSVDSLITDPPAGISFMGKAWDSNKGGSKEWIAWMSEVMKECLRVMKPGAHGLVWAIPRTSHWTASALEDAGFEIRDVVTHIFGSGFPKSHNIEKATGDERFKGFGTALKPASEHWILVRKPCSEDTVAKNVLMYGTGGINIDASRIEGMASVPFGRQTGVGISLNGNENTHGLMERTEFVPNSSGRFPANLVLSHNPDCDDVCTEGCAVAALDAQSGVLKTGASKSSYIKESPNIAMSGKNYERAMQDRPADSGGASRFFYCAKASKRDKGSDNTHPTVKSTKLMQYLITMITPPGGIVLDPFMGSGSTGVAAISSEFLFIGIEKELEYFNIANKRVA